MQSPGASSVIAPTLIGTLCQPRATEFFNFSEDNENKQSFTIGNKRGMGMAQPVLAKPGGAFSGFSAGSCFSAGFCFLPA